MKSLIVAFVRDASGNIYPSVVLGGKEGKNLLLKEDFSWKEGTYIPAALRCYPFGLGSDAKNTYITVEVEADVFVQKNGNLIVQNKETLTKEGEYAVGFVINVYNGMNVPSGFAKDLDTFGLLKQAEITMNVNEEELALKSGIYS